MSNLFAPITASEVPVAPETKTVAFDSSVLDILSSDIVRPSFKLTQGTTPEVVDKVVSSGIIYMPGTGELGTSVTVIPRAYYKASSVNPRTGKEEEYYGFEMYVLPAGELKEAVVANTYFRGAACNTAREILGLAVRNGSFGSFAIELAVSLKKTAKYSWYVYSVKPIAGFDPAMLEQATAAKF